MLLHHLIENAARQAPDREALEFQGRVTTYRELELLVRRLAAAVEEHGTQGDRVALLANNSDVFAALLFAVPAAGRILLPLNPRLSPGEHAAIVARSGARTLIVESGFASALAQWRDASALERVVWLDGPGEPGTDESLASWTARAPGRDLATCDDRTDAWLIYTSGTTGEPKGVVLSHRAVLAAAHGFLGALRPEGELRLVMPFSMSHVTAHALPAAAAVAGKVVVQASFDPGEYLAAIERERLTLAPIAPAMLAMILDGKQHRGRDLSSLEILFYGSSPIAPDLLRRAMEELPDVDFVQAFGQTECTGAAVFLDAEAHRRGLAGHPELLACAGRPAPMVGLRVVDALDADVAPGTAGEVLLRGDQVMSRYWEEPEATASTVVDGWLHTGDIGVMVGDLLRIVDRKKDLIVSGGENVASVEVENVLVEHPAVREAAVVGIPDPVLGEAVCAVVVLTRDARIDGHQFDEADLISYVRQRLASFKKPRVVHIVDELPRNSTGKVLKTKLRNDLRADRSRRPHRIQENGETV